MQTSNAAFALDRADRRNGPPITDGEGTLRTLRQALRGLPRMYDMLRRLPRRLHGKADPIYNFLDRFSRAQSRPVRFVQIGANDGLRNDPIREFVVRDGWEGVLVEPLPKVFELLQANYRHHSKSRLSFVNAAVVATSGEKIPLWTYSDAFLETLPLEDRLTYLRRSSFHREHIERGIRKQDEERFLKSGRDGRVAHEDILTKTEIRCLTLSELVTEYWPEGEIDLLVIDAEGYDAQIIQSIDFSVVSPRVIFFETGSLGSAQERVLAFLSDHGYRVMDLGTDAVAIAEGLARRSDSSNSPESVDQASTSVDPGSLNLSAA